MKFVVYVLLAIFASVSWAQDDVGAGGSSTDNWPARFVKVRAGWLTESPNNSIRGDWEHETKDSHQYSLGLFFNFPLKWQRFRFFAGTEYKQFNSVETLSGNGRATLTSRFYQVMGTFGTAFRPAWAGKFGASTAIAFELWGEKFSKVDTPGFTEELGRSKTFVDEGLDLFFIPMILELSVFYSATSNWQPALTLDLRRQGVAFTVGVNYAF